MTPNISSDERVIRVALGISIMLFGWDKHSWLGLIGILPIISGLVGWCGLYKILGKNTCKISK